MDNEEWESAVLDDIKLEDESGKTARQALLDSIECLVVAKIEKFAYHYNLTCPNLNPDEQVHCAKIRLDRALSRVFPCNTGEEQ